ncbi:hypothetical protein M0811_12485 [Anaeramoeba ignava]|uniref:Transmembrane protein 230 n=1 Tax=Anaeramoeba ignava TaxID=1746090 RepID=A0A9Q0LB00_ANAIG|nr:hypothetical protein M0811_12485 [Anaeramoeba ignava]
MSDQEKLEIVDENIPKSSEKEEIFIDSGLFSDQEKDEIEMEPKEKTKRRKKTHNITYPISFMEVLKSKELRKRKKTAFSALAIFIFGLVLFFMSFPIWKRSSAEGISLFIIGALLLITGGYYLYFIYHAIKHDPGFRFDEIPNYEY